MVRKLKDSIMDSAISDSGQYRPSMKNPMPMSPHKHRGLKASNAKRINDMEKVIRSDKFVKERDALIKGFIEVMKDYHKKLSPSVIERLNREIQ